MQGKKKIGPALLKDALRRAVHAADTIGARAVLVHAKDDNATGFYEHFAFEASPTDPWACGVIYEVVDRTPALNPRPDRRAAIPFTLMIGPASRSLLRGSCQGSHYRRAASLSPIHEPAQGMLPPPGEA